MFKSERMSCSQMRHVHYLYSLCATGVSMDLETRVTLARVSWGRFGESSTREWNCLRFHVCTLVRGCCCVAF
jgi:hypothetical protein